MSNAAFRPSLVTNNIIVDIRRDAPRLDLLDAIGEFLRIGFQLVARRHADDLRLAALQSRPGQVQFGRRLDVEDLLPDFGQLRNVGEPVESGIKTITSSVRSDFE